MDNSSQTRMIMDNFVLDDIRQSLSQYIILPEESYDFNEWSLYFKSRHDRYGPFILFLLIENLFGSIVNVGSPLSTFSDMIKIVKESIPSFDVV